MAVMNSPLVVFLAALCGLTAAIRVPVSYDDTPSSCPGSTPSKVLLCYYNGELSLKKLDPCLCSHLVFTSAATIHHKNYTLNLTTDVGKATRELRNRNPELRVLISVGGDQVSTEVVEALVKSADRRAVFSSSVTRIVKDEELNGVHIDFKLEAKGGSRNSKGGLVALAKLLRKEMGVEKSRRSKRDYSVFEEIDDISTTAWTPFGFKPSGGTRDVRRADTRARVPHRPILRSTRTDNDNYSRELLRQSYLALEQHTPKDRLILVNVPTQPEILAKRYDLKTLSKYVDLFTVPTHNLSDSSEDGVTYHPSRLMGLADILNTDSLLDLLTGLGAPHDKLIITIPATATKFTLKDPEQNTPRSPTVSEPETITQTQLCAMISAGGWTIERDDDLTAPYAFKNDTWLAFDDRISIGIKSKYVILRDLAGAALYTVDSADWSGSCLEENGTDSKAPRLLHSLHHAFTSLARKSRGAVLETLQEDIRTSTLLTFSGDVQLSPYRIVRVVDNLGAVHVVRKDARTQFECSRQGYFRHPLGCNRFYRCVKFNQYSADFTVFEYDCPDGLAFDERWEVCVWPGSLPEGACHGSSEIAPVPKARFACPAVEGYYADPENCRWFFACLDHSRDGIAPLTAYEFRCPFGLVFDERNLLCQWPWLVEGCGNSGLYVGSYFGAVGFGSTASRGYVAAAQDGYVAGGAVVGSAFGAGSRLAQGSGPAIVTGSGTGSGLLSGSATSVNHGSGFSTGYEAGQGILLQDANSGENVVTGYAAGAGRGSIKYTNVATDEGAQLANSYIAGGRSSQRFGNAGSYNEGRHISSYATFPDSLISGGRIENSGGVVLEQNIAVQGIGSEFGVRSGGAAGQGAGFVGTIGTAGAVLANTAQVLPVQTAVPVATYERTAHGNVGAHLSGGVVSSVPVQTAVPIATYERTAHGNAGASLSGSVVPVQAAVPVQTAVPVTTYQQTAHGNAGAHFSGGVISTVPVQAAVPVATYEQTAHGNTGARFSGGVVSTVPVQAAVPLATYEQTAHGNAGARFSGGVVSTVPVQAAVPVATYEQTAHGNAGARFSGGVISTVPVQAAVPVATYEQTAHGNAGARFSGGVISTVPVQAAVPVATYEQTAHGNAGAHFSGGVISTVPVQAAVPVATYEQTAHGNAGARFSGGVISTVPVQAAVPVATYEQTAHGNAGARFSGGVVSTVPVQAAVPVATYEQTAHGNAGARFSGGVISTVPVQAAVPVATYEQTAHGNAGARFSGGVVSTVPVQAAVPVATYEQIPHGNAGAHFSGGVVSTVPVQAAVPVATYEQTSHGNAGARFSGGVVSTVPVQTAVPVATYQQTARGNAGAYLSGGVVSTVPVQTAVPVATYQQTAHGNAGTYLSGGSVSSVPVQTVVPIATYEKTANVNLGGVAPAVGLPLQAVVPVETAVPVATYQKTVYGNAGGVEPAVSVQTAVPVATFEQKTIQTPTAAVVPTFRKPVISRVPFVQPIAQAVPVTTHQQTIIETPAIPVTTYRRPAVARVPVAPLTVQTVVQQPLAPVVPLSRFRNPSFESVSVTPFVPVVAQAPVVSVSRSRKPSFESVAVTPVVPVVEQAAPVVSQPVVPQIQVVNTAPVVTPIYRRTKLRPVTYQTVSTPAPTIVPLQNEFSQVTDTGYIAQEDYFLRRRPAVSVVNGGVAGISIPVSKSNVQSLIPVTPVPAVNVASYSPAPAVIPSGYVSTTPAPAVISGGFVSTTPAVVSGGAITGYSAGNYVSTSSPVVTGSVIQNVPAVKSGVVSGGYSYTTPVSAVFTGGPSVLPSLRPRSRIPIGRFSYSTPAPQVYTATPASDIVTGSTISVTPAPIQTQSLPAGGTVPILRAGLAPAVGYTQTQPSVNFATDREATFRGISLASGLEPALYDISPNLAAGLEIPTAGPALVESGNIGVSRSRVVPTSNIQIGDIQGNGYISSTVSPAVPVRTEVPLTGNYFRGQGAVLSSTVAPIQPAEINTGGFRARGGAGTFISAFPGAVSIDNARYVPIINEKSRNYLPPPTAAPVPNYSTERARGRRPYNGQVTGFVTSTPAPEISSPRTIYPSTSRPTFYQVVSTPRPVTYTVSTPAPLITKTYLPPVGTVTPVPVIQTSTLGYQTAAGFNSRANGAASGRKPSLRTEINYDNENVETLLDKYSGKFGGLLDNNKEGFVSGVITDDLVGRGRISQGGRGNGAQRGRIATKGGYSTTAGYSDGGISTVFGSRTSYSTQPSVDSGSSTPGALEYTRSRGGFSTTVSPDILSSTVRGNVRYGPSGNIDADGGIGYEAVTVGYDGIKSKSRDNPVVVITRLSDVNPLLVAKLGAQCTCKSNTVQLKQLQGYSRDGPSSDDSLLDDILSRSGTFGTPEHIQSAPLPGSELVTGSAPDFTLGLGDGFSSTTPVPLALTTPKSAVFLNAVGLDNLGITPEPTLLVTPARSRARPGIAYATEPSLVDISSPTPFVTSERSRSRLQIISAPAVPLVQVNSVPRSRTRPVVVSTTAIPVVPLVSSTPYADSGSLRTGPRAGGDVSGAGLDAAARAGIGAGRSFDRYGPGGWRGVDETLQGSVDCQRAGLFRHPKYCNKFYACHWDEWKGRFTLHVFNCPVYLAYDTSLGACNWPSKGPACTDDNLLV